MLWETMVNFLKSWFDYPGLTWDLMLVGIALAIAFGVIWLLGYWPPVFKKVWFWPVLVVSAFLTVLAITFVQIPLQYYMNQGFVNTWDTATLIDWLLLVFVPLVLVSGLVQEGAKMVPVTIWWWRSGKNIDPKMGLVIGAFAGAGFGIFEAVWQHNSVFAAGWTTQMISIYGFEGILPFWERFFAIGFHIAVSALAGYGLAKGKGWQFYLIASGLHGLLNWGVVLLQKGYLNSIQLEIYVAGIAAIVTAVVLMLRWRMNHDAPLAEPVTPEEPVMPAETAV